MKRKLMVDYQIISNPLVEIRTEFEYLHKALKAASVFSGNNISHLVLANNVVYLCWGKPDKEKLERRDLEFIDLSDNYEIGFKQLAGRIESIIESFDLNDLDEKDKYSEYSEECYLGCRVTNDIFEDEHFGYNYYYEAFAKVVPSWITLEK